MRPRTCGICSTPRARPAPPRRPGGGDLRRRCGARSRGACSRASTGAAGERPRAGAWRAGTKPPVDDAEKLYDTVDALVEIARGRDVSAAQVALAWLIGRPGVASAIVGARTEEQLADNLRAAELELSEEERGRLDQVSAPRLIYPHWHQLRTGSDRLGAADLPLLGQRLGG